MSEPVRIALVCPKCLAPKTVVLAPISASETALIFQCAACGFQWVAEKPELFRPQDE